MSSARLSAGFELEAEHGLAGRGKHKTLIDMNKSQMSIYSSKLKGLLNKQLDKDKLNGIYRVYMQLSYSSLNSSVRKKSVE